MRSSSFALPIANSSFLPKPQTAPASVGPGGGSGGDGLGGDIVWEEQNEGRSPKMKFHETMLVSECGGEVGKSGRGTTN